eukprot:Hpha_TRINITY_DN13213_c0_g1::TRINITY_DN13213_c0_g1_i2::g.154765::m.154765
MGGGVLGEGILGEFDTADFAVGHHLGDPLPGRRALGRPLVGGAEHVELGQGGKGYHGEKHPRGVLAAEVNGALGGDGGQLWLGQEAAGVGVGLEAVGVGRGDRDTDLVTGVEDVTRVPERNGDLVDLTVDQGGEGLVAEVLGLAPAHADDTVLDQAAGTVGVHVGELGGEVGVGDVRRHVKDRVQRAGHSERRGKVLPGEHQHVITLFRRALVEGTALDHEVVTAQRLHRVGGVVHVGLGPLKEGLLHAQRTLSAQVQGSALGLRPGVHRDPVVARRTLLLQRTHHVEGDVLDVPHVVITPLEHVERRQDGEG